MEWYKDNWPLKEEDYEAETVTVTHVYAYGEQLSVRRLDV
jgi:hypothetical protein